MLKKPIVERAEKEAMGLLADFGMTDEATIKVKPLSNPDWLAQYKSLSQFRPGGIIFWINQDLDDIMKRWNIRGHGKKMKVIRDSILHEFGHVIAEWASKRDDILNELIVSFEDEENFAEGFMEFITDQDLFYDPEIFEEIIIRYVEGINR